jgi:glyoxylase-like metal-dependent hydrolase (beta-lactamase superfamily II)
VYLLSNGKTRLLVDTGWRGDGKRLLDKLGQTGKPDVVILTHTHFDHTGNAGLLKERFNPLFIVQESEKEYLESGFSPIPKGTMAWTRFIYNLGAERVPHWFKVPGVKAGITFSEGYDLAAFGFEGTIIHTPGHSGGSACIIASGEIALAGDAIGGFVPGSVMPPWGDDSSTMIRSWGKMLESGCQTFHPSHGFPVSRKTLEKAYLKSNSLRR